MHAVTIVAHYVDWHTALCVHPAKPADIVWLVNPGFHSYVFTRARVCPCLQAFA